MSVVSRMEEGAGFLFLFVQMVWIRQKTACGTCICKEDSSTSLLKGNGVHQLSGRRREILLGTWVECPSLF